MTLEDAHSDIIQKARQGLGLDVKTAASRAGLTPSAFEQTLSPSPAPSALKAVALALGLDPQSLAAIAQNAYRPDCGQVPKGLHLFSTPFGNMMVNSYLVRDPQTGRAAAFDTGSDCDGLLETVRTLQLGLESVFLTHAHGDHIYDLDRLVEKSDAGAWAAEPVPGARLFGPGTRFSIGTLKVSTLLTCGHSPAGITYLIDGLSRPVAIVGDALFAGSMGGGTVSYQDALTTTRTRILGLPADTLLCPGHGPLTTVALERANNPFFPP